MECRTEQGLSMMATEAEDGVERPHAHAENRGRKSRGQALGASNITAGPPRSRPEADERLMETILSRENMMAALRRVVANKGAPGIDKMSVEQLKPYLLEHWPRIREELLADRYRPAPLRGVEIPKTGGKGMRQLGIPTALDRLIQQAMHQVLMPIFDPDFSASSYGFRPGRSAHDAVLAARSHATDGRRFVVDLDLEKFFDRVNHDVLMARVARKVTDKRVLRLIRRYLQAGLMTGGIATARSGDAARRPAFAAAVEYPARRSRQGTGEARACLLPLRRRLQCLCAIAACRRAGHGFAHPLPCRTAEARGQRRQECRRPTVEAQLPRLHHDRQREAASADCGLEREAVQG